MSITSPTLKQRELADGSKCPALERAVMSRVDAEATALLNEINELLTDLDLVEVVSETLEIRLRTLTAIYVLDRGGDVVSVALMHRGGAVLQFGEDAANNEAHLAIGLDHPLINALAASGDPHRAYFALSYLTSQLVSCQWRMSCRGDDYGLPGDRLNSRLWNALIRKLAGSD